MSDSRLFVFCKTCGQVNTFPSPNTDRIGALALRFVINHIKRVDTPKCSGAADLHIAHLPFDRINDFYDADEDGRIELLAKQDSYTKAGEE